MSKENTAQKSNKWRLLAFVFLLIAAAAIGFYKLMSFQIVQGAEFASKTENTTVITTTEIAARGEIVDRYNRPLAVNKLVLNVNLNYASLDNSEQNEVLYNLIKLFDDSDHEWINDFPIVLQNGEYQFNDDQESQIAKITDLLGVQKYAKASDYMYHIIDKYEISGYSEEYTLDIAAIRTMMSLAGFSKNAPYTFAENVNQNFAGQLAELAYPGVSIENDYQREYTDGTIAPHIIGYIGKIPEGQYTIDEAEKAEGKEDYKDKGYNMDDLVGLAGVEASFESELHGIDGTKIITTDSDGNVSEEMTTETKAGDTVQLTLDSVLQKDLQNLMEEYISGWRGSSTTLFDGGAIAVIDIKSGGVLSAVSYPSYDLNTFLDNYSTLASDERYTPLTNRAFSGIYRPGSAFKTVTAIAGLSEGIITASSTIRCNHTLYFSWDKEIPQRSYGCLGTHGNINVYTALEKSCNIFFYTVGDKLNDKTLNEENGGNKLLTQYANALGLGTDIGLEISAKIGRVASEVTANTLDITWNRGDAAQSAIGQSETMVTPAQMATAAATIANNGTRYSTHIVKSILSYTGEEVTAETTEILSRLENTNNAITTVAQGMTQAGKGYGFVNVAAKTGTPQTSNTKKFNSTIIAYYPADNPEIAFGVVVENTPQDVGGQAKQMVEGIISAYENSKTQIPE